METQTVRVTRQTHATLHELARLSGKTMQAVLSVAVEQMKRDYLLDRTNARYAEMRKDVTEWDEQAAERESWDATLDDGMGE